MVNDGTKDNSEKIMQKYSKKDKRFKSYNKENGGLSSARNYGLNYTTGDYLIFLDSDDYIEKDYLYKVNEVLSNNKDIDLLRIKCKKVDEDGNLISLEEGLNKSGLINIQDLFPITPFETAWSYIYKTSFWKENNFKYMEGKIHEDFGLTPEILMKAKKIYYLDYYGYNYVQRIGSIMSIKDESKILKRLFDILEQYDRLININYNNENEKVFKSFITNYVIIKARELNGKVFKTYVKELKKRKVTKYLLCDTIPRKIKIVILKISFKLYFKIL